MGNKYANLANDRLLTVSKNRYGSIMKVVDYINATNLLVKFENGYETNCTWSEFIKGVVKNPYDKSVYGVGFLGVGKYKLSTHTVHGAVWKSMISRCYGTSIKNKTLVYEDCHVCEEWLNFQNFAQWFDDNYYVVNNERMHLDKDILCKGNNIYSPDTCIFVPQRINTLFVKSDSIRGDLPVGVHFEKQTSKFKSQCKINNGKVKNLGRYNSIEEAFLAYKVFKEYYIKEVANKYKGNIPIKLYEAMKNYQVEITD